MIRRLLSCCLLLMALSLHAQQMGTRADLAGTSLKVFKVDGVSDSVAWTGAPQPSDISSGVKLLPQRTFTTIPPGNYSGLTCIGGDDYAVITDKGNATGYYIFRINMDSDGRILSVKNMGWNDYGGRNEDIEAVAYCPKNGHIYIANEQTATIMELYGGKVLASHTLSDYKELGVGNSIVESLCYDTLSAHFFTINESPLKGDAHLHLRLKELDGSLNEVAHYTYVLDQPHARHVGKGAEDAHGVAELTALGDGSLLVLEREFYVPKLKLGAWVRNKVYRIWPGHEGKQLVADWKTELTALRHSLANYEGMCLGPRLKDGRQVVLLCSDSQNRYKGVLKDWFRTIVLPEKE